MDTYYEILGLKPGASQIEIKKAYFKLIRQYSPEADPEQFQKIREAYELLKNAGNQPEGPEFPPFSEPWAEKMFRQIEIYRQDGDYELYRDACEEAWKRFPADVRFLYLLAGAQRKCGNTGKAVKSAELLVKKEPENKWFQKELAISYVERGYTQKAYFACEKAYEMGVRDIDFLLTYTLECDSFGEYEKGIQILLDVIRRERKWSREEMPELIETYVALFKMSSENADTHQYFPEIMESFCARIEQYKSYLTEYILEIAPLLAYTGVYRRVTQEESPMVERLFSVLKVSCHTDEEKEKIEEARTEFHFQRLMEDERVGETLKRAYDIYFDFNDLEEPLRKYALTDVQLCMIEEREEILEQAEVIRQEYPDYYVRLSDFVRRLQDEGKIALLKERLLKAYRRMDLDCKGGCYYEKYPQEKEKAAGKVICDGMSEEPYVRDSKKIGRNDPCPCGSGKKYKHCCMNKQG